MESSACSPTANSVEVSMPQYFVRFRLVGFVRGVGYIMISLAWPDPIFRAGALSLSISA